ncbi:hypothetical protein [Nocardia africana]|uniref:Uncharacterized protein n=1 Tax=Nocardia africana TaxID=134964 RepID=A0A378WWY4_9NOCA|nr:hypothetical protein [Nocardia africana]MCC3313646.1 hypothetical protein [Nocardia africana]SUA44971.1 Uncharacterised protein [Nocardia africana]
MNSSPGDNTVPAWATGDAFADDRFAKKGEIRFTTGAIDKNGDVAQLLVVGSDETSKTLILRKVVHKGDPDKPIYLSAADFATLSANDEGTHALQNQSLRLTFKPAKRRDAIRHPGNRSALIDATVNVVLSLLLAVGAVLNVWFSRKADTSGWVLVVAVAILVVACLTALWKAYRELSKLFE